MSGDLFTLDTNILICSVDRKANHRHELAKQISRGSRAKPCLLTLQAISEFYVAVTRKGIMPPPRARQVANDLLDLFRTAPVSADAVRSALQAAASGRAAYWDALLVATAAEAGCTTILTEDLADGSVLQGVRILNPFAGSVLNPEAMALLAED